MILKYKLNKLIHELRYWSPHFMTKIMVINNVCIAHDSSRYPLGCLEGILKPSPPSAGHPVMDQPAQFQVLYMCFFRDLPLHLHILCPYNVPYPEPPLFDYKRQKSVIHMPPSPHPLNMTIAKSNQLHPLSFFFECTSIILGLSKPL